MIREIKVDRSERGKSRNQKGLEYQKVEKNRLLEEYAKLKFETLDLMVDEYNAIDGDRSFKKKFNYFMECLSYVIQLEQEDILVKAKNKEYNISYLRDILDNDGPEYALTIGFFNPYQQTVLYEIGVCVRGTPLLKREDK